MTIREIADEVDITGEGVDADSAFADLERRFDELVRTKVRIAPHLHKPKDDRARAIVNGLVDWDRFERENPLPRRLWGKVVGISRTGTRTVFWLRGPNRARNVTTPLPVAYDHPRLRALQKGEWFYAAIKEYPGRVEWLEVPERVPDPTDPVERKKSWDSVPVTYAREDAWPDAPEPPAGGRP